MFILIFIIIITYLQLYNIINRDYKDFITIATKVQSSTFPLFHSYYEIQLEGVDIRVEHLRKPLVDLRMDLTLLNDTMVGLSILSRRFLTA